MKWGSKKKGRTALIVFFSLPLPPRLDKKKLSLFLSFQAPSSSPSSSNKRQRQHALVAALASAGVLETAYLTAAKLTHTAVACSATAAAGAAAAAAGSSCGAVLDSEFASLFGGLVPLPALGLAVYAAVAAAAAKLAMGPGSAEKGTGSSGGSNNNNEDDGDNDNENEEKEKEEEKNRAATRLASSVLSAGAGAVGAASLTLVALLTTTDAFGGATCAWCYASAAISAAVVAATFIPMSRDERACAAPQAAAGASASFLTLLISWSLSGLLFLGPTGPAIAAGGPSRDFELPFAEPEVTRLSSPRAVALAQALRESGAKFYGAFWCSHCFEQKQAFGIAAQNELPYVECYPDGFRRGTAPAKECVAAGIEGFPSWGFPGYDKLLEGEKTFDELEEALKRSQAKSAITRAVVGRSDGSGGSMREGRLAEAPALR